MSNLSGYDGDAVGFESVSSTKRSETSSSTQTSEFNEIGIGSQTNFSKDCGSMVTPEELHAEDDILKEYPPPGLNAFLRKVVPGMLEQLDQTDREVLYESSDSEEDEVVSAKLIQEIQVNNNVQGLGGGDHQNASILSLSWSSAGNSLAVAFGQAQHEKWCEHEGLIRVYTVKRTAGDKLVHSIDISEKNCVTVVKYHPSVAALLAYATTSGEVVLCNLRDSGNFNEGMQLTSPSGCHGSRPVTALHWADATLANQFLTMQIQNTGKRRGAADQILISAGSDGTINVWQVNSNSKVFENVICYAVNGSRKLGAPDINCFDFIKSCPLRPYDEKVADDIFVVGTRSGSLLLCRVKNATQLLDSKMMDPVYDALDGHGTCVLDIAFSFQRPGIFASVSMDSELRVYDINQGSPLKVICLDSPVSCMSWLPHTPAAVVLGLAGPAPLRLYDAAASPGRSGMIARIRSLVESMSVIGVICLDSPVSCMSWLPHTPAAVVLGASGLRLYDAAAGRPVPVDGLNADGTVTAIAVNQSGWCRLAAGGTGSLKVWELPARRLKLSPDALDF